MYTPFTKEAGRPPEYSFSLIYGIEHTVSHIFIIKTWNLAAISFEFVPLLNIKTGKKRTFDTLNGLCLSSNFRDFPTTTASHQQQPKSELRTAWGHVLQPQGTKSNQSCARASCPAVRHRSHISQTSSHHHTPPSKKTSSPSIKKKSRVKLVDI